MTLKRAPFRVFIHDFGSYRFILDSVKDLGNTFENVTYSFSKDFSSTKFSELNLSSNIDVVSIGTRYSYTQQSTALKRLRYELRYGIKLLFAIVSSKSNVIILANTPLISASLIIGILRKRHFIFWHQDFLSCMMTEHLKGPLMFPVKWSLRRLERYCLQSCVCVISISESFLPLYSEMGVELDKVVSIPNWPPDVINLKYEKTAFDWLNEQGVPNDCIRIIYSGRIGKKHNPMLFSELHQKLLAEKLEHVLIILSDDVLPPEIMTCLCEVKHLFVFRYQNDAIYQNILSNVDVGLLGLTKSAAKYSIPSKALTYSGYGLRLLAFIEGSNPVGKLVERNDGFIYSKSDDNISNFVSWAKEFNRKEEEFHKRIIIDNMRHDFSPQENLLKIREELYKVEALRL